MAIIKLLSRSFEDLLSLIYPHICAACNHLDAIPGEVLCLDCSADLIGTNHHLCPENEFTDKFWGRVDLEYGLAAYPFTKKGKMQRLLHQLKYKGRKDIGRILGYNYGLELSEYGILKDLDYIVPVPLHPNKMRERGYNQAACIAEGVSQALEIPVVTKYLVRKEHKSSQTIKSRIQRFESIFDSYQVQEGWQLSDSHVLLVDDVITTGATLEACALRIKEQAPGCRISMLTLAIARH